MARGLSGFDSRQGHMAFFVQCDGCLKMPKAVRVGATARLPDGWAITTWGNVRCPGCFEEDATEGDVFVDMEGT